MFSLAMYLKERGYIVSGSDNRVSENVKTLKKNGIGVFYGHDEKNVLHCDALVYSLAVEGCVEIKKAKDLNVIIKSRAEFLSEILNTYKTKICVAGAHGKTTTTALIYHILKTAGLDPSLHLGANLASGGKSYEHANGDIIVCEACEYKDSFLQLSPTIGIILNIAPEHLDYFKTFDNLKVSFQKFSTKSDLLVCSDEQIINHNNKIIINQDFVAKNIKTENGLQNFDCYKKDNGKYIMFERFNLNLLGKHNVYNALFAIAVACRLGVSKKDIKKALVSFGGVKRRLEKLSSRPLIIHDYAHHPDEIRASVETVKNSYKDKVFVVFQPHTYSRTKILIKQFADCFKGASVGVYRTYSAREKYQKAGSAKTLAGVLNAEYFNSASHMRKVVKEYVDKGYVILFLGAGSIDKIATRVVKQL